jgi:hypothetical protein
LNHWANNRKPDRKPVFSPPWSSRTLYEALSSRF